MLQSKRPLRTAHMCVSQEALLEETGMPRLDPLPSAAAHGRKHGTNSREWSVAYAQIADS